MWTDTCAKLMSRLLFLLDKVERVKKGAIPGEVVFQEGSLKLWLRCI